MFYEVCDQDVKLLTEYFKRTKQEGYDLEYIELPDRLKVSFRYKNDYNPGNFYKEYVEFLDDLIICYGEFGTFTFKYYNLNRRPSNFYLYSEERGVQGQFGMISNLTGDIETLEYNSELAQQQFYKFLDEYEYRESYNELDDWDKDKIIGTLDPDDTYVEKSADVCRELVDLIKELGVTDLDDYDLWSSLGNIGQCCTQRTLTIIMIITLIGVDYNKK